MTKRCQLLFGSTSGKDGKKIVSLTTCDLWVPFPHLAPLKLQVQVKDDTCQSIYIPFKAVTLGYALLFNHAAIPLHGCRNP